MKKLLLVLLFFANVCHAQNYQCLQKGIIPYYTNGDGYLRGMRIDSVIANGVDTIFYPYHTPRGNYVTSVLDSTGGSWLGKKVIKQANGTFLFDDMAGDTVVINTQANVGDTWTFYRDTTDTSYIATVTGIDTMTILGAVDSVKRIVIKADTNGVINELDPVNNFEIILSKNHGFVQIFDLYTFPYRLINAFYVYDCAEPHDYYLDLILGNLVSVGDGCTSSGNAVTAINSIFHLIPFHNPSYGEIYNYSVGQVLESEGQNSYPDPYASMTMSIDTVLSKSISGMYTNYSYTGINSTQETTYVNGQPPIINTSSSPFTSSDNIYDPTLLMDTTYVPEEWNAQYFYHFFPKPNYDSVSTCPDTVCIIDQNHISYPSGNVEFETMLPSLAGDGPDPSTIGYYTEVYSIGYGQIVSSTFNYTDYYGESSLLIYSDRNGNACGRYSPPLSVNEISKLPGRIDVFPNPVSNTLSISATSTIKEIIINNIIGQTVFINQYDAQKVQVNVSNLPTGIYFVRINGVEVRKIVKQ